MGVGAAAASLALSLALGFAYLEQPRREAAIEAPQIARELPPLVEMSAAKHDLRASGAAQQGQTLRYDAAILNAFHGVARHYPVTQVGDAAAFAFSTDKPVPVAKPVALAAVEVVPPRRPAEFRQAAAAPAIVTARVEAAPAALEEAEPRILNIRVPGLGLARDAVATTGHVVSATTTQATAIVGRGVDAGLNLFKR